MKILFITAEGFDTPNPNNQMAETMINGFLDAGNSVHLIQSHKKGVNPDLPNSLVGRENFTCDTIVRKVVDKTKFVKRYFNDLKYFRDIKKYIKNVKDADVIYVQSNPTVVFLIKMLKRIKKKTPIVYSIYDVFPGHARDIGVIKSKLLYNAFKWVQKPCYKKSDAIVVLSEDMKNKVTMLGAKEEDVFVVPAWFDVKTAREIPKEENQFIKKYDIPTDKFYVQFAGTIGYVFNYKTVLELAKRLEDTPDIRIQIIGDGNVKSQMMEETKVRGITNIDYYPLQPIAIVPDVYSACDISVIPLMKGVIGYGVPSKAPILMAVKRPIVNSVETDSIYAKTFIEKQMGYAVDIEDYDGLEKAVKELYNDREKLKLMAENAYKFGQENYSSVKSINKLLDVFNYVIEK